MQRLCVFCGSNAGGTNELLPDEWLHPPGDAATLARQMLRVCDPDVRARLAKDRAGVYRLAGRRDRPGVEPGSVRLG